MTGRRILMTADAIGGVWQYTLELARHLAPLGYEIVLVVLGPLPSRRQVDEAEAINGLRLIEAQLTVDWLAESASAVMAVAQSVAALAKQVGADLIHLNQPAFAAEPMPVPVVAVAHSCVATWWAAVRGGRMPEAFGWQTDLVAAGLKRADRVVAPSGAHAESVRRTYELLDAPAVVYNGRTPIVAKSAAPHDFVFTAGRLWDEGKNVRTLDAAAARLAVPVKAAGALDNPGGGGVTFDYLHALGPLGTDELAAMLAPRPVFASAAFYEPFGLAVLEAAQAGCALVLSDISTFRELWEGAAVFVAPGNVDGFVASLQRLVGDPAERLACGEIARAHAARFTSAAMAAGMDRIYRDVMRPARRHAA